MYPDQRLAGGTDGICHEQLRHHDALEEVRSFTHDDRIDVVEGGSAVGQRSVDRLAHESVHRDVGPFSDVLGLPGAENRSQVFARH